jgi:hypothetical protein
MIAARNTNAGCASRGGRRTARANTVANDICGLRLGLNLPFSVWGRFREMPCGLFAQEFGGGWITHELSDFEAEIGLAAIILSVVHAFGSRLFLFDPDEQTSAQLPLYAATASGGAD